MLSYEAWTDGRTAVCHNKPVFWRAYKNDWPISWNYEYIIFGQIIFQNFHQFKAFVGLSDCRTIGLSDYRTVGLSDCRIIATAPAGKRILSVFNATFNNISAISSWSVLLVEETGGPGKNHRPVVSHWQTLSHNVVSSTPRLGGIRTHDVLGDIRWLHR